MFEKFVKGPHAHRPHPLGDEVADGVIHHRGGDAGLEAETVGQVGGDVELAAADMDFALAGLAEGDDARVKAVDQRAQGHQVKRATWRDIQAIFHCDARHNARTIGVVAKKV